MVPFPNGFSFLSVLRLPVDSIFTFGKSVRQHRRVDDSRPSVDLEDMERRYRSVRAALHPGERPELQTNYSCSTAALADLGDPNKGFSSPPRGLVMHIDAQERLEDFNDRRNPLSSQRREALRRIERLHTIDAQRAWYADVIFKVILTPHDAGDAANEKIFPDLDVACFEGKLRGNVFMTWKSTEAIIRASHPQARAINATNLAMTCLPGTHLRPSGVMNRRIWIVFNSDFLRTHHFDCLASMVHAVAHEMIHAYLQLLCGDGYNPYDRVHPIHGELFARCADAINNTLMRVGFCTWY